MTQQQSRFIPLDEHAQANQDYLRSTVMGWGCSAIIAGCLAGGFYFPQKAVKISCWVAGLGLGIAADVLRKQQQEKAMILQDIRDISDQARTDRFYYEMRPQAQIKASQAQAEQLPAIIVPSSSPDWALNLMQSLRDLGIEARFINHVDAASFIRAKIKPAPSIKTAKVLGIADDLMVQVGFDKVPLVTAQPGYIAIDVPKKDCDRIYPAFDKYPASLNKPTLPIGVSIEGKLIEVDPTDPNSPHILVGGTSGSGKSVLLVGMPLSLIERFAPEEIEIAFIDPKRVTFNAFADTPWTIGDIAKTPDEAIESTKNLVAEMERRYKLLEKNQVPNIDKYNAKSHDKMSHIFLFIDEYAELIEMAKGESDKEFDKQKTIESNLIRIAQKARAAGIHLVLGTQKPLAELINSTLKENLPVKVCLRCTTQGGGLVIMGENFDAKALLGKGDLMLRNAEGYQRLQSLFVDEEKLPDIIKELCSNYTQSPLKKQDKIVPNLSEETNNITLTVDNNISKEGETILSILVAAKTLPISLEAIRKSRKWESNTPTKEELLSYLDELLTTGDIQGNEDTGYWT